MKTKENNCINPMNEAEKDVVLELDENDLSAVTGAGIDYVPPVDGEPIIDGNPFLDHPRPDPKPYPTNP